MKSNKDEYIKFLENKVIELSKKSIAEDDGIQFRNLIKYQEEFLLQKYNEKDFLISERERLISENSCLLNTIVLDQSYINYLLNSHWWKITVPLRKICRVILRKKFASAILPKDIDVADSNITALKEKVSIIIFTYNAGNKLSDQLENLNQQKNISNMEVIIVDRGSDDNTVEIAEKYKTKVIKLADISLTDSMAYEKILPQINGSYVVIMAQNKIVNSKYWIYQSIKPIVDKKAAITVFFKNGFSSIKSSVYYRDLKNRMVKIANEYVLFMPDNRDIVQYISPLILDKSSVIVKKRVSNLFLI